jgi:hypothetical protein
MVDITVNSAELNDGVLTVTGSGFTKTTTSVYLDNGQSPSPFEVWSDGEIRLNVSEVNEITVTKGDVTRTVTVVRGGGGADPQTQPTGSDESPSPTTTQEAESPSAAPSDQGPSTSDEAGSGEPFDPGGDVHEEGYKTAEPNVTPGDLVEDDLKTTADQTPEQLAEAGTAGAEEKQDIPEPNREAYAEGEHLGEDFRFRVENTAVEDITKTIGPRDPYPEGNPPSPRDTYYLVHGVYPKDDQASDTPQSQAEGAI